MSENTTDDTSGEATVSKAEYDAKVKSLSDEAAGFRAQRNASLREGAAFKAMLQAHNVPVDLNVDKLAALTIEDGQVSGSYEYSPPKPRVPASGGTPNFADTKQTGLTRDQLDKMSYEDINANWDKVQAAMKSGLS